MLDQQENRDIIRDFYGPGFKHFYRHPWDDTLMCTVKDGFQEKNYQVSILAANIVRYKKGVAEMDERIRMKKEKIHA